MDQKQNLFPVSVASDTGIIQIKTASSAVLKTTSDIVVGVEQAQGGFVTRISAGDITGLPATATIADGNSRLFFLFANAQGELNWSVTDEDTTDSEFGQVNSEILDDRGDRRLIAIIDIANASSASFIPGTTLLDKAGITFEVFTAINVVDGSIATAQIADDAVTTAKILDANVTTAKIADDNVTTAKILDGAVTYAKLGSPKFGIIQETIAVADFTDNEDATGTIALSTDLPAGAVVLQSTITGLTGFAGDTSATVTIGDGSTADRYNTGTPNVFTTADSISAGAVSGTAYNLTAVTPTIVVTGNADFTSIVTDGNGEMTITIFYLIA